jgi:hypothetical protein
MRKVISEQFLNSPIEILVASLASGVAIAGLLYFNWLIAVSRSVSLY